MKEMKYIGWLLIGLLWLTACSKTGESAGEDMEEFSLSFSVQSVEKDDISIGGSILIDDGLIELHVKYVDGPKIYCTVINGGELGERKGVNVPGVKIKLPALTDKDKEDIRFGMELVNVSDVVKDSEFVVFKGALENGGSVRGINAKGQGEMPRKKSPLFRILKSSLSPSSPYLPIKVERFSIAGVSIGENPLSANTLRIVEKI